MADEMIGERDAFEAWWSDWQRGTWDASIDREMPAHWNEDSRSRMELAYQAGRASLAASAGSEPVASRAFLERALSAMEGVIDVADRQTDEFEALRSCVIDLTLMLFKERSQREARPCHVFTVRKAGPLTEWAPTTMAFALPDGEHALYTHPSPPEGAGWISVPKEPTAEMKLAAQKADMDHSDHEEWLHENWPDFKRVWDAMIAASPRDKS